MIVQPGDERPDSVLDSVVEDLTTVSMNFASSSGGISPGNNVALGSAGEIVQPAAGRPYSVPGSVVEDPTPISVGCSVRLDHGVVQSGPDCPYAAIDSLTENPPFSESAAVSAGSASAESSRSRSVDCVANHDACLLAPGRPAPSQLLPRPRPKSSRILKAKGRPRASPLFSSALAVESDTESTPTNSILTMLDA